ncbi:homeotic protein female sterile [Nilaparvata lugens]|uniref:homeotic protein female sterile n=1 Tax=Nilaparvata lugens TaxID=108931 RepID=UPI00193D9CD8|nr:homeotic protein female sterile [Nilaparvata lugens]
MSEPNRNDSGGGASLGGGGANHGGGGAPNGKKRSIDDIINDLQYEGQYMLLGSSAPGGQMGGANWSQSANSSPNQLFLQQQQTSQDRQQMGRGLYYDGVSPTRIQELSPSSGEMIGMVDMGNGNFVNVVFNPSAATRNSQLHHQLSNSSPTAQQPRDPYYVHHQQLLQQNPQLLQQNQQLHQQMNQQLLGQQNQQLLQQNSQQLQQQIQNQQLLQQNSQLLQQKSQLHQQNPQQLLQQTPPQLLQHQTTPTQTSAANQVHANEYGLFSTPSGGKPVVALQANQQLIENLVGNWLPNQSGTYSPFGCSNASVQSANENGLDDSSPLRCQPPQPQPQPQTTATTAGRKPRAVAEVRPMRPTYSDVLTKSAPPAATAAAVKTQPNATAAAAAAGVAAGTSAAAKSEARKQGGKGAKSGSKDSQHTKTGGGAALRRQHSSGSDDTPGGGKGGGGGGGISSGSPFSSCSPGGGGGGGSSAAAAGVKRWASLEDLASVTSHVGGSGGGGGGQGGGGDMGGAYEAQETGGGKKGVAGKAAAKAKKGVKSNVTDDKNETLNNHKVNNANLSGSKRPLQINNNIQRNRANIEKNVFKSAKKGVNGNGKEDSKSNSSPLSPSKRGQRSGKRRQGNTYIDMIWTKWQHYMKLFAHWLLNLVWDVMALSTRLFVHLCQVSLDYSATTARCGWRRVSDMLGRPGNRLGRGGTKASSSSSSSSSSPPGDKPSSTSSRSWWRFWRRGRSPEAGKGGRGADRNSSPPHEGLANNMALPTTGDDAIKRLLSCKGKDPYSILGVTKRCHDEEIKRYYKKQAVLVHPDKNSQPGAEEAFKILVHAFELIGEPERRSRYDQCVAETHQMEHAWTELNELLTRLHEKMEYTANTLRCTNCGKRHRRTLAPQRPTYAARYCHQCNIHHSAREGDIWAESWALGLVWHYYACMEGQVYDISEWAACQADNLQHLKANTHQVQYRIVLGRQQTAKQQPPTNASPQQHTSARTTEPDFEDFLNNLYSQSPSNGGGNMSGGDTSASRQRRKTKRKK